MSSEKARSRPWEGSGGGESLKRVKVEAKPLKELDSEKLKKEIKRWAKAVVAYARQLSGSFSSRQRSSRQLSRSSSSVERPSSDS